MNETMNPYNDFGVIDQFGESLAAIKQTSRLLRPFNYPNAESWDEQVVEPLKEAVVELDDYIVRIHYTSCEYESFVLDYIKVNGYDMPILPSRLVLDIGRRTFSDEHLGYFSMITGGKRYYWWMQAKSFQGTPVPLPFGYGDPTKETDGLRYTEISLENMQLY